MLAGLKRFGLLIITNIFIVITISLVLNLLGVQPYLSKNGISYDNLLIFCLVRGFAGSFISLLLSRFMAKMMMGVKVVDPQRPGEYSDLVARIHDIAKRANLPAMPEVGVYDSPEINAFATGPGQRFSLVAVSTGLLQRMNRDEVEGVLAHEIAHIKNGDMVTMTLLQGAVNAFVMFLSRVIAFAISQNAKEESRPMINWMTVMVLEIDLGLLGMMVVMWLSRAREFKADAGASSLVGANKMIAALQRLLATSGSIEVDNEQPALAALKINGGRGSWMNFFASHPPLERRIEALKKMEFA